MRGVLAQIKADGVSAPASGPLAFGDFVELMGLAEIQELDRRFTR